MHDLVAIKLMQGFAPGGYGWADSGLQARSACKPAHRLVAQFA